ncbi:uncharacterized membrane-anchored protein YjiN (DUF445 family) [Kribbella sp. VKM Ac-2527]|uniref:Uncharacterized membrane-anchored protein YjiN (DUF445 family) n=1 Tax=Kribbella caucasensis TaxID=2512215 RepID=A0A4R6K2Q8_9ACTN|nr:DUF445 domain-containing protein [Kribbella sp. VKM Ac-2527]TDO43117.1 uncharacterized membrane-anchored protein YjiN (DUF445 family) [Kribbella sp. VKM Ac-2527]
MATLTLSEPDLIRRRGLRQMRGVAVSLLLLAAAIYLVTLHQDGGWGYVNAAAEAAMVGALADWFAVTALFRHPLGLPIPHTAIVPTRKDSLAESLEQFVTENFLSEAVVAEKMRTAEVSRRAGEWLAAGNHAERIVAEGARTIGAALPKLGDADVTAFVQGSLLPRFEKEPLSPIAGHFLESVVDDGAHHALFELLMVEAYDWLHDNRETLTEVVGPRAPRWSPRWVDSLVIDRIHREALAWLADVRDNHDHAARKAVDRLLRQLADDLQRDPEMMERFETFKRRMLTHPDMGTSLTAVWDAVRTALIDAIADPGSTLQTRATQAIKDLGKRLQTDDTLRAKVDVRATEAVSYVIRTYGREIVSIISDTIERWDGREASARIELHVGRDLQFIRINGTVVGALVGLLIHTFSELL